MSGKQLVVLLDGTVAGHLHQADGTLEFDYDEAYLAGTDPTPLSLSMPVAQRRHVGTRLSNFLWGLLPDNARVLERWAARFETTAGSVFGLLSGAGEDCAGAVQFVRPERIDELSSGGTKQRVDDAWIAARVRAIMTDTAAWLPPDDIVANSAEGLWSLAGAQPKFALGWEGDHWVRPTGIAPTTHIFKPNTSPFEHFDLNEHLCLEVARRLGLPAAGSEVHHFHDERVLVVERYDRILGSDRRIHQEDLCQALALHPERKYQNAGGPSVQSIRALLDARLDADQGQFIAQQFLRSLAVHWLVLNTDGHAKNFSLLLSGSQVRLAPLYDVASACVYQRTEPGQPVVGELRASGLKLAMSIGGEYEANRVTGADWRVCADHLRLDQDWVMEALSGMAGNLPAAVADARPDADGGGAEAFADRFTELIERRSTRCIDLLRRSSAPR